MKAALHNLGCKVNEYEMEQMTDHLRAAGFDIVPFAPGADVYVINTCSVTNIADRKSRQMLHRAKKMNPAALIVAVGCAVDVHKAEFQADSLIDVVLTNKEKLRIAEAVMAAIPGSSEENNRNIILKNGRAFWASEEKETGWTADEGCGAGRDAMDYAPHEERDDSKDNREAEIGTVDRRTRAFLKIQDGCNQFCTYCIIPYARGSVVSKTEEEILQEARGIASRGIREVVLTGIHISSYGAEWESDGKRLAWEPAEDQVSPLLTLLGKVHKVEGFERIRLGSLEPRIITEPFAQALASLPKLCPQFHLSLQSGSDTVLRRMNRHYTCAEYETIVRRLRRYFPDAAITTDIIVGFPGETDEEFRETLSFAKKIGFSRVHVFRYSRRKGTAADRMADQVPEETKAMRSEELIRVCDGLAKRYAESFTGKMVEMLFEEPVRSDGKRFMTGYTKEYLRVYLETEENLSGQIAKGTVVEAFCDGVLVSCLDPS